MTRVRESPGFTSAEYAPVPALVPFRSISESAGVAETEMRTGVTGGTAGTAATGADEERPETGTLGAGSASRGFKAWSCTGVSVRGVPTMDASVAVAAWTAFVRASSAVVPEAGVAVDALA